MIIGMFFSAAGSKPVAFIATEDIGVFAGQALLKPDDSRFKNTKIDLAAGSYDINDVSRAIEKAQGHTPWLARYTPTAIRNLLPHDFKEMMKCKSDSVGLEYDADLQSLTTLDTLPTMSTRSGKFTLISCRLRIGSGRMLRNRDTVDGEVQRRLYSCI